MKFLLYELNKLNMFKVEKFVQEKIEEIKRKIGKDKAIIACSGGIDSTVAAILVKKAIGNNLVAVFVNTGFLRKNEAENTKKMLEKLDLNLKFIDAGEDFVNSLKGVTDPEEKRKIIGEKFVRIFEKVANNINAKYLVQGTIALDWIESGGGLRHTIKSHHNVGGLPDNISLQIIEPLRDLYKDEVRKIAEYLNIPIYEKQPFPGPGLAVRILGEVTKERLEIVREANSIVEEEIERFVKEKKINKPWQYFAVLIPVKTVGVQGDIRSNGYIIAIRAVESLDGMSASYSKLSHEILEKISIRITNTLKDYVNRVVYDITNKPPATIEWE